MSAQNNCEFVVYIFETRSSSERFMFTHIFRCTSPNGRFRGSMFYSKFQFKKKSEIFENSNHNSSPKYFYNEIYSLYFWHRLQFLDNTYIY